MGTVALVALVAQQVAAQQAWGSAIPVASAPPEPPVLEFYGGTVREMAPEDFPRRACVTDGKQLPWWMRPFAMIRLRMGWDSASSTGAAPRFRRSSPPRGFCTWLAEDFWLCKDCPHCIRKASDVVGTHDFAAYLPPSGGCLYLDEAPKGAQGLLLTWEHYWDLSVVLQVAVGAGCVWGWRSLRESRLLHAALGAVGFLAVLASAAVWFVMSRMPSFIQNQPGAWILGRSTTLLVTLALAFVPAARDVLIGWVVPKKPFDWLAWLSVRDPFYDLPVGWIVALAVVSMGVLTVWLGAHFSIRYFASAPEPEGSVEFRIGGDGERIDVLPPTPLPQRVLGAAVWLSGLALLLFGTHSDAFSVALAVLVLVKDRLLHCAAVCSMAGRHGPQPEQLRDLVSVAEYEQQGRHYTEKAIRELQKYVAGDPTAMWKVREDSALRLRRFSEGGPHCRGLQELDEGARRNPCVVQ